MRHSLFGGLWVAAALFATPTVSQAQFAEPYAIPGRPEVIAPLPTGNPSGNGFYGSLSVLFGTQSFGLGDQTVAVRGLIDVAGFLTGQPGTLIGSGFPALTTDQFGRRSYSPGYQINMGYKFDNGISVYGRFGQLDRHKYSAGATGPATPFFRNRNDLADSYLTSAVFNFPADFAGPDIETTEDLNPNFPTGNFYGIWNGAAVMDIQYEQGFTYGDLAARVPMFETEYSRVYGFAGLRYGWFFERFYWRTVGTDIRGISFPQDVAIYTNTLSQRMYGPMLGCGHEIYVGKRFAVGLDLSGAALMNLAKERVKYKLGDETTQAKRKRLEYELVPNVNADFNLMWYPIEGVQISAGYSFQTYWGTRYMKEPIAFNFGALDPAYNIKAFRYVSMFNFGVGFFF
ncbi:MAG: hypothetical protein KF873_22390 [Gemmataceae bacterium]|nr:hypothetical protein [Planctomycetia bacterium]MBX3401492.1 hypothetical protein [Gemmataceae bacterium]